MGRLARALAVSLVAACSGGGNRDDSVATNREPIAYGTLDTTHTAVVSVLAPVGSTSLEECSGSVVGASNGIGYVLTAAHCCNTYVPTIVVAGPDYSVGEAFVGGGTPSPPVYSVVPGSVYYDAQYTGADHDFCLLEFSGAPASMPTLALPTSGNDGLALGTRIEHVGYGMTDTSTTNSQRRTGTDTVDLSLTALLIEFSQGGATQIPGTCEGDSGGPSLLPAGAPQSQQVVVGVQSFGNASSCTQETLGGASRVSSEMGAGRFITSYLAGSPIGVPGGSAPPAVPAGRPWTALVLAMCLGFVSLRLLRGRRASPSHVVVPGSAFGAERLDPGS